VPVRIGEARVEPVLVGTAALTVLGAAGSAVRWARRLLERVVRDAVARELLERGCRAPESGGIRNTVVREAGVNRRGGGARH
jgi:hypothetical protein